jgi:hypothetical protein
MLGVIAKPSEEAVVREFFELFKTPWEFFRSNRPYDVVLCTRDCSFDEPAKLIIFYAGRLTQFDGAHDIRVSDHRSDSCVLLYEGNRIPIYGETVTLSSRDECLLRDECSSQCAGTVSHFGEKVVARIGYDLFGEVSRLLTNGQPALNADIPTLEWHIELLRKLVVGCGVPLVEIPPVPEGYQFVTCLTHDVDHPSLRRHRWDYTMFGFLYRALLGSVRKSVRGSFSFQDVVKNWTAAAKLPFVYLGLAEDPWREFGKSYREVEKNLVSTFFVIAFKNYAGKNAQGRTLRLRASRYEARDIANTIEELMAVGCEIGLHGVDAWLDSSRGSDELNEIRSLTQNLEIGVRMHWLFYDQESPVILEKIGVSYDSTVGYNETIGYRAGTTQVYKLPQTERLLELPLHVMDTALFYPAHLGLSTQEAMVVIDRLINNAARFGGCLTVNWHDRSMFPERLWGKCYCGLIEDLKTRGAWFATAGQAVRWFRKRRAAVFEADPIEPDGLRAKVPSSWDDLPPLQVRTYKLEEPAESSQRRQSTLA